jgi:hypothetical protein
MIQRLCDWLVATPLSVGIQNATWVVPAVQSLHILLIAVVMGSVAMLNRRLLGWGGNDQSVAEVADRFFPWIWGALPGLALTGAVLIIAEPARELTNPVFAVKLSLLLVVVVISAGVRRRLRRNRRAWERADRVGTTITAKVAGGVSLLLWVGIVVAGRWIAYFLDV